MAGISNETLYGKNADFTSINNQAVAESNGLATNGQLWIGSTAVNAGNTHINVGTITSPGGTVTIGYSSPNITLDLAGGAAAIERIAVQTGTSPILPAGGTITMNGATVAAGTNPVRTDGTDANTLAVEVQISQALAAADATKIGLSNFNSAEFTVSATGFVSLLGNSAAIEKIGVQGSSGTGTNPVLPTIGGQINFDGSLVAAGTTPLLVASPSVNVVEFQIQLSQAIAAADNSKTGLSNFDSSSFSVSNGFVTLSTTGAGKTITGDSGGALSPTANNWNILGLSGSKTSGSGSTLTIKSPPFSQIGSSATSSLNTGEFVTAAVTRTLPVSAGLADGDLFIYSCTTAGALIIQAVGAQKIRIGTLLSSAAGTATSTAIGDSLTLRFDATQGFFMAVGVIGTWIIA